MKQTVNLLTILLILLSAHWAPANSVTYRISVTIPEIIGVNSPDPDAQIEENTLTQANTGLQTQYTQIVRKNQTLLLETIVAK